MSSNRESLNFTIDDINVLRKKLSGKVYLPGDQAFDTLKRSFARTIEHEPALIIEVENTGDVQLAVQFAVAQDLLIAVQATGHGATKPCKGQLLINTARLNHFTIDKDNKTLMAEAGVLWADAVKETEKYGLAPLSGFAGTVGVAGYTLTGGFGWLVRKYGLALDQVISFELVTLQGDVITVSHENHADLFWGACAASNLGIITSITMHLLSIRQVFAAELYFYQQHAEEVVELYRKFTEQVPQELTSTLSMMPAPPFEWVPEDRKKEVLVSVKAVYLGDENTAKQLLLSFAKLKPAFENHKLVSYAEGSRINHDPTEPGSAYGHIELLNEFSSEFGSQFVSIGAGNEKVRPFVEIRHVGGAMADNPNKNAFGNRDANYILHLEIPLLHESAATEAAGFVAQVKERVAPFVTGNVFLNFMAGKASTLQAVKSAYGSAAYERLLKLKKQYDLGNRLCFNHNIDPAEE